MNPPDVARVARGLVNAQLRESLGTLRLDNRDRVAILEEDVIGGSVRGWILTTDGGVGPPCSGDGASIDEVARMLGVRSLDRAAALIGWKWDEGI